MKYYEGAGIDYKEYCSPMFASFNYYLLKNYKRRGSRSARTEEMRTARFDSSKSAISYSRQDVGQGFRLLIHPDKRVCAKIGHNTLSWCRHDICRQWDRSSPSTGLKHTESRSYTLKRWIHLLRDAFGNCLLCLLNLYPVSIRIRHAVHYTYPVPQKGFR